jgi:hypothetical protein
LKDNSIRFSNSPAIIRKQALKKEVIELEDDDEINDLRE